MGTQKVQMKGVPSLVGSLGLSWQYKTFLFCLGCSSPPSTPCTISMPLSPSPSKLCRQPCWVICLLVCVSEYALLYTLFLTTNFGQIWTFIQGNIRFCTHSAFSTGTAKFLFFFLNESARWSTPPESELFLNRRFRLNRLSSPLDLDPGFGTEGTPLLA